MTLEDALATLFTKSRLSAEDESDFRNAFQAALDTGDFGGVDALLRVYARLGTGPDTTALQDFAVDLTAVSEMAAKLAPIAALVIEIAPFL